MPIRLLHLSLLLLVLLCGCKEAILHDLVEQEANRLLAKLHENNIEAEKIRQADGRWSLNVDRNESLRAVTYLNGARLLRSTTPEIGDRGSLTASREEQRFRFERAMSAEIERTLQSLSGVLEARVHLNLPPTDPLFGQPLKSEPGSASVLLVVDRRFHSQVAELQALVAGASGVDAQKISVVVSPQSTEEGGRALATGQMSAHETQESEQVAQLPSGAIDSNSFQREEGGEKTELGGGNIVQSNLQPLSVSTPSPTGFMATLFTTFSGTSLVALIAAVLVCGGVVVLLRSRRRKDSGSIRFAGV